MYSSSISLCLSVCVCVWVCVCACVDVCGCVCVCVCVTRTHTLRVCKRVQVSVCKCVSVWQFLSLTLSLSLSLTHSLSRSHSLTLSPFTPAPSIETSCGFSPELEAPARWRILSATDFWWVRPGGCLPISGPVLGPHWYWSKGLLILTSVIFSVPLYCLTVCISIRFLFMCLSTLNKLLNFFSEPIWRSWTD